MKKLFALRKSGSDVFFNGEFFEHKPTAKLRRDELNARGGEQIVVTKGPEHREYRKPCIER